MSIAPAKRRVLVAGDDRAHNATILKRLLDKCEEMVLPDSNPQQNYLDLRKKKKKGKK